MYWANNQRLPFFQYSFSTPIFHKRDFKSRYKNRHYDGNKGYHLCDRTEI